MYCKTALCKSSFIRCVAAIAGYKGSLQYVGGKKTKMDITRPPLGKPQKKDLLLMAGPLIVRGRELKGRAIKEKITFLGTFFVQRSKVPTAIKLEGGVVVRH